MTTLSLPNRPVLLDGGMGRELRFRGVNTSTTMWSAQALLTDPSVVRRVHADFIASGAEIITTNTYGIIRKNLADAGLEDRFAELNTLACHLAQEARETADHPVWIAGSLPPLRGSYRPDLVGDFEDIMPQYQEQAELLAPHVDVLLCETMSSAAEGRTAAWAACQQGKPVWVAWTLHEDRSGRLRSGESIAEAVEAVSDLPVSGFLVNCCVPESVTQAMPYLVEAGAYVVGGYANTFQPVPETWTLGGTGSSDGFMGLRDDLEPASYANAAASWLQGWGDRGWRVLQHAPGPYCPLADAVVIGVVMKPCSRT